jgi:phosphonate transport system substrate-binding protein
LRGATGGGNPIASPKETFMSTIRNVLMASVAVALFATPTFAQSNVLRIGMLGGENETDRLADAQCLVDAIPAALGVDEVQLFPAADYDGVVQGLLGGTLDVAGLGASAYAAVYLQDPTAVEPFLTTVQTDGSTGYYSIGLAKKDAGIATMADAQGKRLGYADPDSTSGYLVPLTALPATIGAKPDEFFSSTDFGGGHENLVLALLDDKFDVVTTWGSGVGEFSEGYTSGNIRSMVDKGLLDMEDVVEVWKSPLIPNGPLVMRSDLPQEMKDKIVAFFTALPTENYECFRGYENGDYQGYTAVTPEFYQAIIDARKATIGD